MVGVTCVNVVLGVKQGHASCKDVYLQLIISLVDVSFHGDDDIATTFR